MKRSLILLSIVIILLVNMGCSNEPSIPPKVYAKSIWEVKILPSLYQVPDEQTLDLSAKITDNSDSLVNAKIYFIYPDQLNTFVDNALGNNSNNHFVFKSKQTHDLRQRVEGFSPSIGKDTLNLIQLVIEWNSHKVIFSDFVD